MIQVPLFYIQLDYFFKLKTCLCFTTIMTLHGLTLLWHRSCHTEHAEGQGPPAPPCEFKHLWWWGEVQGHHRGKISGRGCVKNQELVGSYPGTSGTVVSKVLMVPQYQAYVFHLSVTMSNEHEQG